MRKRVHIDQIRLRQLYRKRETRKKMAEVFRCSMKTIDRALRAAGLYHPDCYKIHSLEKRQAVIKAYRDGMPVKRIRAEYNVPLSNIALWARGAGLPFRRKKAPDAQP